MGAQPANRRMVRPRERAHTIRRFAGRLRHRIAWPFFSTFAMSAQDHTYGLPHSARHRW
jgi:ribosomal protein L2